MEEESFLSCVYFIHDVVFKIDEVVSYHIRFGVVGGKVYQKRWYVIEVFMIHRFDIGTKL